jgi:hypothetical protein
MPRRKQHPLLNSLVASHPKLMHAATVASHARKHPLAKHVMGGLGGFGMMHCGGELLGGVRHRKPRATVGHAKNQARGAIVRQVMMQHGMTLPQASHYVKAHNIPY